MPYESRDDAEKRCMKDHILECWSEVLLLTKAEISTLVDGLIANAKIAALKSKIAAIKSHDQMTAKSMEAYIAHLDRIDRKLLSMKTC